MTQPPEFDREVMLGDMLAGLPRRALDAAMARSVGPAWELRGAGGELLRAGAAPLEGEPCSVALVVDLDRVGTLSVPAASQPWLEPAGKWIELLLGAANRYRMAADLHLEAVHADHRELTAKHAALQESEQRYRLLSEQLEERVREQVGVIEQAQRRMYQAEKMASIGNLAAGMAHEINNPIGFMRSNLSTAKGYVATLEQAFAAQSWAPAQAENLRFVLEDFGALLDESISGGDRVARIIGDLKAYAAAGEAPRAVADPLDAVHGALRLLGDLPPGVTLVQALEALPPTLCDIEGVKRAVLALLVNARTAMRGRRGEIRISAQAAGPCIEIAVSDQGCGIEPALIERIFNPFFTTHDTGGGMGLGLTVASDIARAHGGHVDVASRQDQGSTFTLRIARQGANHGNPA